MCSDSTMVLPTSALSQLQPVLLQRTTARTSGWLLQWCSVACNSARQHCSLLTDNRLKKEQYNCCVVMHGDAPALKGSLNHCWYCVSTVSLEKKNIGIMSWYLQMQPILQDTTHNWVTRFSHSTPCYPEQQFCFPGIHCWTSWARDTKFISFSC